MEQKVLIVEDELYPAAHTLRIQVTALGYKVIDIAASEKEALQICRRERPHIVLMDIQLQDPATGHKDDIAGVRAAQTIHRETGAQIIYLTQFGSSAAILDEVSKTSDFQLLHKPVSDLQLVASMRLASLKAARRTIVFLCYSHDDAVYADEMQKFFRPHEELGIDLWSDQRIGPGQIWREEISKALQTASVAICLVSIDFINSDFIRRFELPNLLKAAAVGGTAIIPAYIRPVQHSVLERKGLSGFQGINAPENTMAKWPIPDREECWAKLAEEIHAKHGR